MIKYEEKSPKKEAEKEAQKAIFKELISAILLITERIDRKEKKDAEEKAQDAANNAPSLKKKFFDFWTEKGAQNPSASPKRPESPGGFRSRRRFAGFKAIDTGIPFVFLA